jgi:hypothetical protein
MSTIEDLRNRIVMDQKHYIELITMYQNQIKELKTESLEMYQEIRELKKQVKELTDVNHESNANVSNVTTSTETKNPTTTSEESENFLNEIVSITLNPDQIENSEFKKKKDCFDTDNDVVYVDESDDKVPIELCKLHKNISVGIRFKLTKIYICPISRDYSVSELKRKFSIFGNITSATIINRHHDFIDTCGFISFEKTMEAVAAIQNTSNTEFLTPGLLVETRFTNLEKERINDKIDEKTVVHINKMPHNLEMGVIVKKLSGFGVEITYGKLHSAGFAFFHLRTEKDALNLVSKTNGFGIFDKNTPLKSHVIGLVEPSKIDYESEPDENDSRRKKLHSRSVEPYIRIDKRYRDFRSRSPERNRNVFIRRKEEEECRFFRSGNCARGSECRYLHKE